MYLHTYWCARFRSSIDTKPQKCLENYGPYWDHDICRSGPVNTTGKWDPGTLDPGPWTERRGGEMGREIGSAYGTGKWHWERGPGNRSKTGGRVRGRKKQCTTRLENRTRKREMKMGPGNGAWNGSKKQETGPSRESDQITESAWRHVLE